jgi:hypothetical protein
MSDAAPNELRRICWSECFGFVRIFRSFGISIGWSKLVLAFAGILVTCAGGKVLDTIWPKASQALCITDGENHFSELNKFIEPDATRQSVQAWIKEHSKMPGSHREGMFSVFIMHIRSTVNALTVAIAQLDAGRFLHTIRDGLVGLAWLLVFHWFYAIVFSIFFLAVWGLFGGAIARLAAMHAAREERIPMTEGLRFSREKLLSFMAAPLLPAGAIIVGGAVLAAGGLVGLIPGVGEIIVGALFFLALLAGLAIALISIGAVVGFPLMHPTIAVEGSDGFDAVSRTYAYVYQRPWHTALYMFVSLLYGAICLLFVKLIIRVSLIAVHFFVGLTLNWGTAFASSKASKDVPKLDALWTPPTLDWGTPMIGTFDASKLANVSWFGQLLMKLWVYAGWAFLGAFVVSFFYCASTIIYLLLRKEVDATDIEDVYIADSGIDGLASAAPAAVTPVQPKPGGGTSLPVIGQ